MYWQHSKLAFKAFRVATFKINQKFKYERPYIKTFTTSVFE